MTTSRKLAFIFAFWLLTNGFNSVTLHATNGYFGSHPQWGYENFYFHLPVVTAREDNYSFRSNMFLDLPVNPDGHLLLGLFWAPFTHGPLFNIYTEESFFSYGAGWKQRMNLAEQDWELWLRFHDWKVLSNPDNLSLLTQLVETQCQINWRFTQSWHLGWKGSYVYYRNFRTSTTFTLDRWFIGPQLGFDQPIEIIGLHGILRGDLIWQEMVGSYFSISMVL